MEKGFFSHLCCSGCGNVTSVRKHFMVCAGVFMSGQMSCLSVEYK